MTPTELHHHHARLAERSQITSALHEHDCMQPSWYSIKVNGYDANIPAYVVVDALKERLRIIEEALRLGGIDYEAGDRSREERRRTGTWAAPGQLTA